MEIYYNLPNCLQSEIIYYILEHPTAKMIKDEIIKLKCDRIYKFKVEGTPTIVVDGLDFFCNTYFSQFEDHSTSTDFNEQLFDLLFEVTDTSDDD